MLKHVPNAWSFRSLFECTRGLQNANIAQYMLVETSAIQTDFQEIFLSFVLGRKIPPTTKIRNIGFHGNRFCRVCSLSLSLNDTWASIDGAFNFLPTGDAKTIATSKGWPFRRGDVSFPTISFNHEFPSRRTENRNEKLKSMLVIKSSFIDTCV